MSLGKERMRETNGEEEQRLENRTDCGGSVGGCGDDPVPVYPHRAAPVPRAGRYRESLPSSQ